MDTEQLAILNDKSKEKLLIDADRSAVNRSQTAREMDKWIIGGGTSLILASAGFLQITGLEVRAINLLFITWTFFALASGFIMFTCFLIFRHNTHSERFVRARVQGRVSEPSIVKKVLKHFTGDTNMMKRIEIWQYPIAFVLLLIGVCFFGVFMRINVRYKNDVIMLDRQEQQKIKNLELEKLQLEIEILKDH